jgi:hypothetical protein
MQKSRGGGMRKNPPIGLITGRPANVNNKFVYGSGVGTLTTSVRRRQLRHATSCDAQNGYNNCAFMLKLGS